ncbi:MAG: hypothetical protein Q9165_001809 [Trypethelium subeluteriae]
MADSSEALGKRKRETQQAVSKKRAVKHGKRPKSSLAGDLQSDASAGINEAIGHMDSSLLADYVAQTIRRSLRKFQSKDATVAKLFAKHIKFKEAVDMVKKFRIGIGVGTPQRLIDLLDNGALSSKDLERIVIDASHINQKKRGIFDMKETEIPLTQLLLRKELKSRYSSAEERINLLFF